MEPFVYYSKSGASWTPEEDRQLIQEYNTDLYDIMKIGYIHKRTPGGIACRLQKLVVIDNNRNARGYNEYKRTPLYNEIVSSSKDKQNKKTDTKVTQSEIVDNSDISILKKDMSELNKKVDKILYYMTALYDFESS